ncbi:MAG: leucyl aminopeptidase family protein [Paracoccaceae bacterium]
MTLIFSPPGTPTKPLYAISEAKLQTWISGLDSTAKNWVTASDFTGAAGTVLVLPNADGEVAGAAVGMGDEMSRQRQRFLVGAARDKLPAGDYSLRGIDPGTELDEAALGWLLAGYRYDRYAALPAPKARLAAPLGVDIGRLEAIAAGEALTRDLINTPSSDMGPAELEDAVSDLANQFVAEFTVIRGDDLLKQNFPMIHAVGRASARTPRLIDMTWGARGPKLTLVGKGVCFDTGGLNIKPGASMGLMKKDMGGAATVLGLAQMIMSLELPLQLRVLIPAAENSISSNAFRPQDILTSRKGLTVEINNTDAEGRLVLADALALADEEAPDLIVSMATLTGAARVAVGTDLAPFYATKPADANAITTAARQVRDPVWQMPFWDPYEDMIEPGIADLDNAPKGGMAGSITAALFLRRFATQTPRYLHFDISGWQPTAAPGRPKGGVGPRARAILQGLPDLLKL